MSKIESPQKGPWLGINEKKITCNLANRENWQINADFPDFFMIVGSPENGTAILSEHNTDIDKISISEAV